MNMAAESAQLAGIGPDMCLKTAITAALRGDGLPLRACGIS